MSRRAGKRRGTVRAVAWPGPHPWSRLRPGDEFTLTTDGAQRFRVVCLMIVCDDMPAPCIESRAPVVTLSVDLIGDPGAMQHRQRLIVTAIAVDDAGRAGADSILPQ